jgi:cytochrome b561
MGLKNSKTGWGWPARLLHWSIAGLILFMLGVGFYMVEIIGDDLIQRYQLTQTHKSWGFVVFSLALIRVVWRLVNPTPAMPAGMSRLERAAAHGAHLALYVLMIALPVTGWLMASASPLNDAGAYPMQVKNMVFGLFELPDPIAPGDKALSDRLADLHAYLALAMAVLLSIHAAAAIRHQFFKRDGLIRRMILGR